MDRVVKIIKKIKIRNILILILLLTLNTYAWFIYATRVSTGLTAHVSSWNVEFVSGTGEIITNILIEVDRIYPGMATFEKDIDVHNKGETKAELSYQIESLRVMDQSYVVGNNLTSEQLENKIKTEYPFKIIITKEYAGADNPSKAGSFNIMVEWPFESGNDELDTFWGNRAHEYYALNPGEKSIELNIKLIATQQN